MLQRCAEGLSLLPLRPVGDVGAVVGSGPELQTVLNQ